MKRYQTSLATVLAVGIPVMIALAMRRRQHRKSTGSSSWLMRAGFSRFGPEKAAVFILDGLNQENNPRIGGAGALRCSDTGGDIPVANLVDVPGLLLYSIEAIDGDFLLLFMQVPSVPKAFTLPFLDRGVRAVAEVGSMVYVARIDAVETVSGLVPFNKLPPADQSRVSIVWNTGRCGSTLMHKMLQRVGVLSFTEPYWFDAICDLKAKGFDNETIGQVFGVCGAIDVMLARKSMPSHPPVFGAPSTVGQGHVSFNPKGKCFMCMEGVMLSLPYARHIFMYRDVRKVAESFGSVFFEHPSPLEKLLSMLPRLGKVEGWGRRVSDSARPAPVFSSTMASVRDSGRLVLPSKETVRMIATGWMEAVCLWTEILGSGLVAADATIGLRMDEYVRKDPEVIEEVLRFVLGSGLEVSEDVVALALEAFKKHSQEGDKMANSSFSSTSNKPRFLSDEDTREIEAAVAAVGFIGTPDYILPDSLGVKSDTHAP